MTRLAHTSGPTGRLRDRRNLVASGRGRRYLFVRSVNGRQGDAWFHGPEARHLAHIRAGWRRRKEVVRPGRDFSRRQQDKARTAGLPNTSSSSKLPTGWFGRSIMAPSGRQAEAPSPPTRARKFDRERSLGNSLEVSAIGLRVRGHKPLRLLLTIALPKPKGNGLSSLSPHPGGGSYVDDALRFSG